MNVTTMDSQALFRRFTEDGSDEAFAELVARYVNLVHSVAMRRAGGDVHLAQDISQKVFADLASKGRRLPADTLLGGWLHRHTCFVASTVLRAERRRQTRERVAVEMNTLHSTSTADPGWQDLAPLLDEAVDALPAPDRDAIVLRYFEQRDLRSIGQSLGTNEDAAQKRVSRALEKLRTLLAGKGVALSATALGAALATHAVVAAPQSTLHEIVATAARQGVKSAGLATGLLALLPTGALKIGIAITVVGSASLGIWWSQRASLHQDGASMANVAAPGATLAEVDRSASEPTPSLATNELAAANAGGELGRLDLGTNVLGLVVVSAENSKPVPNVRIDLEVMEISGRRSKKLVTSGSGICMVPVTRPMVSFLQLTMRLEGYGDTRLEWRPDRGETIPDSYTVRLVRAAKIGGRVVDAEGQPVAGAEVGMGYRNDPLSETRPESHLFGWIGVKTDEDGRWSVNRIAPSMISRLSIGAHHPAHVHAESLEVARQSYAEKQLQDGTHVFRLGRAITIRGFVRDEQDAPIEGASVLVGHVGETGNRTGSTDATGSFAIEGCRPGENLLSAEAEGYAATTRSINAMSNSEPFVLKLGRGSPLHVRVVDASQNPIAGASAYLRVHESEEKSSPPVQTEFSRKTDGEGRWSWLEAPNRTLRFDFHANGFLRRDHVPLNPGDTEHVIVLSRALTITGKVTDESGRPIPRFRIVCGWPDNAGTPNWSNIDRFWLTFSGGKYRHRFDETIISATTDPKYVLKFEAEGYASFVSRIIAADEGEANVDVVLRPANDALVAVVLPGGRPAVEADVGLVSGSAGLVLRPGGFSWKMVNSGALRRTDASGRFRLPPDVVVQKIVVAHSDGVAFATADELRANPVLHLSPWSRVDGIYLTNGIPASGLELLLNFIDFASADLRSEFKAQTDGQGRFSFPQAPSGRHCLIRLDPYPVIQPTSWGYSPVTDVDIPAGETVQVTLGGNAAVARLNIRWPEGLIAQPGWNTSVYLQTLLRPIPGLAAESLEAIEVARKTPNTSRIHRLDRRPDGAWIVESVPPGRYLLYARVVSTDLKTRRPVFHATASEWVDIPPHLPGATIDLGALSLAPMQGEAKRPVATN